MRLLLLDTLLSLVVFPFVVRATRGLSSWVRVPPSAPPGPDDAPLVTVLVPARNEERSIDRCVGSLLAQDYPRARFRVVVIDDRSEDATPAILARLGAADGRLRVVQGTPLPAGWQGKCWALHQAVGHAEPSSAYLLFTDADTVHAPSMLASVVAFAERERLDLLSLGPGQDLETLAERALLPSILALSMSANGTLAEVNDASRPEIAKAVGQFILYRAEAYRALGGHAAVRGEIVEDFALARRAKRRRQRILLADGRLLVRTRMYRSLREIWEGFSKNSFDEARRQPGGAVGGLLGLPVLTLGPWALGLLGLGRFARGRRRRDGLLALQALAQVVALLEMGRQSAAALGLPRHFGLAQPVGMLFLWGILANSTWRTLSGRGITWKGRTY